MKIGVEKEWRYREKEQYLKLIGIVSHELRNPLTVIKFGLEILEKDLGTNQRVQYYLSQIKKGIERISCLITDYLDIGKIEAGTLAFRRRKLDLNNFIREQVEEFQVFCSTHKIVIKGQIKEKVLGNKDRLSQVLVNLLSNAIKYSPQGKKVVINLKEKPTEAIVGIKDFGIGIAKKKQIKLFTPYYRINLAEEKKENGTGLGLYIASELVTRHGGKLWVKSEKGKGATFYFSLPKVSSFKSVNKANQVIADKARGRSKAVAK